MKVFHKMGCRKATLLRIRPPGTRSIRLLCRHARNSPQTVRRLIIGINLITSKIKKKIIDKDLLVSVTDDL